MAVIVDIVNALIDVKDSILNFVTDGAYDLLTQFTAYAIKKLVIAKWEFQLVALQFSWDVAQEIITSLNISAYLNAAWSSLNSSVLQALVFFRVPEAVNIILSAATTKFVFRFLGF